VTLMEAMAPACRWLSTWHSVSGTGADGRQGCSSPSATPSLAAAIERLMTEPGLGPRLAARAWDFVAAEFNAETEKLFARSSANSRCTHRLRKHRRAFELAPARTSGWEAAPLGQQAPHAEVRAEQT
jgi:hypothetical protein